MGLNIPANGPSPVSSLPKGLNAIDKNGITTHQGTNGQLGHGDTLDRNVPKIIEVLSMDGSTGQQIEASKVDISSEKSWVSPSDGYAVVPNENVSFGGNGNDVNDTKADLKRMRV